MNIYVAISGHGYGHLIQISPVIERLIETLPDTSLVIQSSLPKELIESHITSPFTHIKLAPDVGMIMDGALDVQAEATYQAHLKFHAEWPQRLKHQSQMLSSAKIDLVISDIAYLPLQAAQQLGIPNIALCSLNWAEILQGYLPTSVTHEHWFQLIQKTYQQADRFIIPAPGMPMTWLDNRIHTGPTPKPASSKNAILKKWLGIPAEHKMILINLGGIETQLPVENWTPPRHIHCLIKGINPDIQPNLHPIEEINMPFSSILASSDLLLTKPGYGMFAEAGCSSIPTLYVKRSDWPEEPYLVEWLHRHTLAAELGREAFENGEFFDPVEKLLAQTSNLSPAIANGAESAVEIILNTLQSTSKADHPRQPVFNPDESL